MTPSPARPDRARDDGARADAQRDRKSSFELPEAPPARPAPEPRRARETSERREAPQPERQDRDRPDVERADAPRRSEPARRQDPPRRDDPPRREDPPGLSKARGPERAADAKGTDDTAEVEDGKQTTGEKDVVAAEAAQEIPVIAGPMPGTIPTEVSDEEEVGTGEDEGEGEETVATVIEETAEGLGPVPIPALLVEVGGKAPQGTDGLTGLARALEVTAAHGKASPPGLEKAAETAASKGPDLKAEGEAKGVELPAELPKTELAPKAGPDAKAEGAPAPSPAPAASAPRTDAPAPASSPQPVLHQVPLGAVPVEIGLKTLAGINRFEIRLDPAELGRIDVRLDIDDTGEVKAHLVVDRVETLALLQRDAKTLERAFEQAGLKPSEGGIDLTLRDPSGEGRGRDPGREETGRGSEAGDRPAGPERPVAADPAPTPIRWRGMTGVDVRI